MNSGLSSTHGVGEHQLKVPGPSWQSGPQLQIPRGPKALTSDNIWLLQQHPPTHTHSLARACGLSEPPKAQIHTPVTCLGRGSATCFSGRGQAPHKETGAQRVEGPRPRPHLESLFQDLLPWHSLEVQPGAEAHHQPPPPLLPHLPEEGSFLDQRRHLALGHTPPMKGTPGSTQAQFGSSDPVHQQRFSVQGPPKCPTATAPPRCVLSGPHPQSTPRPP